MRAYIPAAQATRRRNIVLLAVAACGAGLLSTTLFVSRGAPPQSANGDGAFQEINALSTTVASGDLGRLDRCETALQELTAAGKLPQSWSAVLAAIIAKARSGNCRGAAEDLRRFVRDEVQPASRGGTQDGRKRRN